MFVEDALDHDPQLGADALADSPINRDAVLDALHQDAGDGARRVDLNAQHRARHVQSIGLRHIYARREPVVGQRRRRRAFGDQHAAFVDEFLQLAKPVAAKPSAASH